MYTNYDIVHTPPMTSHRVRKRSYPTLDPGILFTYGKDRTAGPFYAEDLTLVQKFFRHVNMPAFTHGCCHVFQVAW